jgi:GNAT superfamily N-acetyltransferase
VGDPHGLRLTRDVPRGVSIRIAGEEDLGSLIRLRRVWAEENAGRAIDDPAFVAAFTDWWARESATRTFFLAKQAGEDVGMANVKRYDRMPVAGRASGGCWGYVGNVFVLAERRNTGIGRVLMDELVSWAGAAGYEHLRLAPSLASWSFYRRLGFAPGAVAEFDPPQV